MRTEQYILNLANNTIGQIGLTTESISDFSIKNFYRVLQRHLYPETVVRKIFSSDAKPETLGEIVSLSYGPGTESPFRQTPATDFYCEPIEIKWNGANGRYILTVLARSVVFAAMYDILATEMFIKMGVAGSGCEVHLVNSDYHPKPAMLKWVMKNRLKITKV